MCFEACEPIISRALSRDRRLFLHPETGSWIIVREQAAADVQGLLQAARLGMLDRHQEIANTTLIRELHQAGLLIIDDHVPWNGVDFTNDTNKINTLILKMVGYCNIACTYCYDFAQDTYKSRLDVDQGRQAIDGALRHAGRRLNILFHGGEPLLAFDTVKKLVRHARSAAEGSGVEVLFSIQTNGTRLTSEIVEYLTDNEFSVGISLDGPQTMNDVFRVDFKGNGTWKLITDAVASFPALKDRLGILTTVTKANADQLYEVACYFRDFGIRRWDVTIFQAAGRAASGPSRFAPQVQTVIGSYKRLMDGIEAGEFEEIEIRPVLHYLRNLLGYERPNMCLRNGCGAAKELVSVSADGMVEACDCISEPTLSLGKIGEVGLDGALSSDQARQIRSRSVDHLSPCITCDWRMFCGGTCLAKVGDVTKIDTGECAMSMALFPELLNRLAGSDRLIRYAERFANPMAC